MFDAVLFDMDGTLLDSEVKWRDAFTSLCADHGISGAGEVYQQIVGATVPQVRVLLADWLPARIDRHSFESDWLERVRHDDAPSLKPGAQELVAMLDVPVAVVTSTGRRDAERLLNLSGLWPELSLLVSVDDVTHSKPHPDPYLTAARQLGVDIARCAAFEDSDTGTRAAVASGAVVVQVPDFTPPSDAVRGLGHVVADTLIEGAEQIGLIGRDRDPRR